MGQFGCEIRLEWRRVRRSRMRRLGRDMGLSSWAESCMIWTESGVGGAERVAVGLGGIEWGEWHGIVSAEKVVGGGIGRGEGGGRREW